MKYLLQIATAVAAGKRDDNVYKMAQQRRSEIGEEIQAVSSEDIDAILGVVYPDGIRPITEFYDCFPEVQYYTGFDEPSKSLIAKLWVRAYGQLQKDQRNTFLEALLEKKGSGVWRAIFSFPEFCSKVNIELGFAAGWFCRFGDAVKDDMANWDFFNGVRNYALHFPGSGLKVLEKYVAEELDELKIALGGLLLGTIRSQAVRGHFQTSVVERWDKRLRASSQIEKRMVYHRSLPTSFDLGTVSRQVLNRRLGRMLKGEAEEVSEAFHTVCRCLHSEHADSAFVAFAMKWFFKHASGILADMAKHHVVRAMWYFCTPGRQKAGIKVSEANDLIVAIQPIRAENRGTWENIEQYLVERLREDGGAFENFLGRLVDANPEGFLEQLRGDGFSYFKSEVSKGDVGDLFTRWALSKDRRKRRIAQLIFQDTKFEGLSESVVVNASEEELELALLQAIWKPLLGEKTSSYFLHLEPAFREVGADLRQRFKNEMTLQAINYPGACLEEWKKIEAPSGLLRDVVRSAEDYFEGLRSLSNSPARDFAFAGCEEAAAKEAREFSRKVAKGAREKSVFAKLAKHVDIIYGSTWAVMTNGEIGAATGFNQLSHSMEFPRLEAIDPEGMAIRRLGASGDLRALERSDVEPIVESE